ncbi:MAG: response regulator [Burkholderiaceae bacterium]
MKIFVVEDSQSIRRLVVRRLEALAGAQVVGEASGEAQALALINWLQPDTVLLDLSLAAGGSGLHVLTELRRSGFNGRVLVLTHQALDAYREACEAAGADGFYDKSSGLDTLFDELSTLIESEPPAADASVAPAVLLRDGLTGLFGEWALMERLDQSAKIADRDGTELAVYVVLLKGLNALRQEHGAAHADELLRALSSRLMSACAASDVLARHAPDQFSLVLTRVESADEAALFALRLTRLMDQGAGAPGPQLQAQLGVALFPGDATGPRSLLTLAEARAYGGLLPGGSPVTL